MSSKKIERWIDVSALPRYDSGRYKNKINWKDAIGMSIHFMYGEIKGTVKILKNIDWSHIAIYIDDYTNNDGYIITKTNFIRGDIGNALRLSVAQVRPDLIKYFVNKDDAYKYSLCSTKITDFICDKCGTIRKMRIVDAIYLLNTSGSFCHQCSDGISYPEKFIMSMLKQLNIKYKYQYSPDWISPMRYDFYLLYQNKKYIIECDGGIGHGKKRVKDNITPEETKLIDMYKDEMALKHNIQVIRIDCDYNGIKQRFDFIKNNIENSILSNIFDLSKINFQLCDSSGVSSLLVTVCNLFDENTYNIQEIADNMNLTYHTIYNYLSTGSKMLLCDYDPVVAQQKASEKRGKRIKVYKDDKLVASFNSIQECSNKSMSVLGTKLNYDVISKTLRGIRNSYKGFTFEYDNPNNNTKLLKEVC